MAFPRPLEDALSSVTGGAHHGYTTAVVTFIYLVPIHFDSGPNHLLNFIF